MVLALLIAALVCFIIAAVSGFASDARWGRIGWGWLGLVFITIMWLVQAV